MEKGSRAGTSEQIDGMKKEDCPRKEVFVQAFMGELAEGEKEDFYSHVNRCPKCGLQFAALTRIQSELEDKDEAILDTVLSENEAGELKKWAKDQSNALKRQASRVVWRFSRLGAALAGSLVLVLLGYFYLSRGPASHREVRRGSTTELRLLKPGEKLKEAPVFFSWTKVEGVDHYDFTLIDNALNTICHLNAYRTDLRLPVEVGEKLTRRTPYLWTVKAIDDHNRTISSGSRHFEIE
ncbi:MAG: hypothetical protein AB1715_11975 [Acidobacteriota bacterium]